MAQSGSGKGFSFCEKAVASALSFRASINSRNDFSSIKGKSQANTNQATSGYLLCADKIPLKGPLKTSSSTMVLKVDDISASCSLRMLIKVLSQLFSNNW